MLVTWISPATGERRHIEADEKMMAGWWDKACLPVRESATFFDDRTAYDQWLLHSV